MKLNYTSLQHAIEPVEAPADSPPRPARRIPVAVLPLHGHLAPVAWAAAQAGEGPPRRLRPGRRRGAARAALGGRDGAARPWADRRAPDGGARATAASARRSASSAPSTRRRRSSGGTRRSSGRGPASWARSRATATGAWRRSTPPTRRVGLGLPTIVSPRMSAADPRPRHVGLSHHTRSVLELLLRPVAVPVPEDLGELWPESGGPPPRGLGRAAPAAASAGRPRRLRRLRAADSDDGQAPARGPALLRGAAGRGRGTGQIASRLTCDGAVGGLHGQGRARSDRTCGGERRPREP